MARKSRKCKCRDIASCQKYVARNVKARHRRAARERSRIARGI